LDYDSGIKPDSSAVPSDGGAPSPDASIPEASIDGGTPDSGPVDTGSPDAALGGTCPASPPTATQFVVYDDALAAGWASYGFNGPTNPQSLLVCSGTKAVRYVAKQYDGLNFEIASASAVSANHFSAKINVDHDSDWAVMALPSLSADAHCYRLPLANCGGSDPACGQNQTLAPCIQHWKAGWQAVELDIPTSTTAVAAILFEQFSASTTQIVIDDVRLTRP
jgi:hypothetical protein